MIIDASVAVKWFFEEEDSALARDLVGRESLRAPPLFLLEVGNAIWKKARKGQLHDLTDAVARHAELASVVEIVPDTADLAPRALEIALSLEHAIYDCMYVALAEAERDVVVTADGRFRAKIDHSPLAGLVVPLA